LALLLCCRLQPYTISIPNITEINIDRIPAGISRLVLLKPLAVNMSLTVHDAANLGTTYGPFNSNGDISMPTQTGALDITIDVPACEWVAVATLAIEVTANHGRVQHPSMCAPLVATTAYDDSFCVCVWSVSAGPWIDGNSAAINILPGPAPPSPPSPPPRPPLPPAPPIAANTTVVVANFYLLE
jgi:hypothetical protein